MGTKWSANKLSVYIQFSLKNKVSIKRLIYVKINKRQFDWKLRNKIFVIGLFKK